MKGQTNPQAERAAAEQMSLQAQFFILRGGHLHTHRCGFHQALPTSCLQGGRAQAACGAFSRRDSPWTSAVGPWAPAPCSQWDLLSACSRVPCREPPGRPAAPWERSQLVASVCLMPSGEKLPFLLHYPASQRLRRPTLPGSWASLPFLSSAPLAALLAQLLKAPACALRCRPLSPWPPLFLAGVWVLNCVWLFETPWTPAHQVPLCMGFFRQDD